MRRVVAARPGGSGSGGSGQAAAAGQIRACGDRCGFLSLSPLAWRCRRPPLRPARKAQTRAKRGGAPAPQPTQSRPAPDHVKASLPAAWLLVWGRHNKNRLRTHRRLWWPSFKIWRAQNQFRWRWLCVLRPASWVWPMLRSGSTQHGPRAPQNPRISSGIGRINHQNSPLTNGSTCGLLPRRNSNMATVHAAFLALLVSMATTASVASPVKPLAGVPGARRALRHPSPATTHPRPHTATTEKRSAPAADSSSAPRFGGYYEVRHSSLACQRVACFILHPQEAADFKRCCD